MTLRLVGAILLLWIGPLHAQDAETALRRAEEAYRALTTLTADFSQTITNPMLGGPELASGVVYLERPSRFAMRFDEPVGDRIVADGTWLWLYAPSSVEGQVMRQAIPQSGIATPNLMGQFAERTLERYDATYVGTEALSGALTDVLQLVPHDPALGFREAQIAIARADGIIRRMVIVEDTGQRRTLEFRNIRLGVELPESELRFVVPAGVRVVDLPRE
jgi:outer membrane lipoprotein carrier protein